MKKLGLILCAFLSPAICFAADCFSEADGKDIHAVLHINQHRDVWPGFEKERSIFAFSNQELQQTVILGVREQELRAAELAYERCDFSKHDDVFFLKDAVNFPPNGLYDIRLIFNPGTDALGKFAKAHSLPVIQIKAPNDLGFGQDLLARTAIHEGFHGIYQFSSGAFQIENPQPRDFLEKCRKVKSWYDTTLLQNSLFAAALKENSRTAFAAAWKEKNQLRRSLESDPSAKSCLDAQRFWERIEGSARFVETEAAYRAGIISLDELNSELSSSLESGDLAESFFYYSGNAMIRMAKSLGIENWQKKIDQGSMIDTLQ